MKCRKIQLTVKKKFLKISKPTPNNYPPSCTKKTGVLARQNIQQLKVIKSIGYKQLICVKKR